MDDEDERYFLNANVVSRHLYCSICQEVFTIPMRAPCGHSYCDQCISNWLVHNKTCPEDRKKLTKKDMHRDFILENIINDQMVACSFRRRGCQHIDRLGTLAPHIAECTFNPANLPAFISTDSPLKSMANNPSSDDSDNEDDLELTPNTRELLRKARLKREKETGATKNTNAVQENLLKNNVPKLGKPSLSLRLFAAGGETKELLCDMFDSRPPTVRDSSTKAPATAPQSIPPRPGRPRSKRGRLDYIDDSD